MIYLYIAVAIYLLIGSAIATFIIDGNVGLDEKIIQFVVIAFVWLPFFIIDYFEH